MPLVTNLVMEQNQKVQALASRSFWFHFFSTSTAGEDMTKKGGMKMCSIVNEDVQHRPQCIVWKKLLSLLQEDTAKLGLAP